MFNIDQTNELQQKTNKWLLLIQQNDANKIPIADVEDLKNVLRFHENRYYILNSPLISDFEYDTLYKYLENIEKQNPSLITKDSPTQRVGNSLNGAFETVQHLVPMLSLENSYNAADLIDWDRKAKEISGLSEIEYCVEPKFDGASISLIFENNFLERAATRGDGIEGEEITTNTKQIKSVPLSANFKAYGIRQIEIRGEVLINKNNFKNYNNQLVEQGLAPLANPRNAAAGSLRMKDPKEVSKRNLEAFIYHVSYSTPSSKPSALNTPNTHFEMITMLWQLGFKSPVNEMVVVKGIDAVIQYVEKFETLRDQLPYEIDGMVIKVNELLLQDKLGMTTHHPRWAIAYKFKARQGTSKLLKVEFQVGRTGSITPVAKIEPVHIGGVTISSISLFNEEVVKEKDLRIGDTVLVERAGDVIPYIVKPLVELRTGSEAEIIFPKHCPVCNDELYKPAEEAVWRCININCKAQVVERIIHFVSKDAMDIKSFGEANVRKFYDLGFITDIPSIYEINFDKIATIEGFGKKSTDNLQAAIAASKTQPLHRIIFALGIRYIGETTAKTLAAAVSNLLDFVNYTEEQLQGLDDVGTKVSSSIVRFFKNEDNLKMLEKLKQIGISLNNDKKNILASEAFISKSFLFTGTLTQFKRSDAEAIVEKNGGNILGGVSSKLNYLIVGADAGSKLEKAKKIPTIHILTEDEFFKMIPA